MAPLVRHETLLLGTRLHPEIRRPSRPRPKNQITARGLHYPTMLSKPVLRDFVALIDSDFPYEVPHVDTSVQFSNINNIPVQSTMVSVERYRFLVLGYYDPQLPQNLNLHDAFPHLPWHGEIVVFSVGQRTRLLSRPAAARYIIRRAVSLFIRGACQAHMVGDVFPGQISFAQHTVY